MKRRFFIPFALVAVFVGPSTGRAQTDVWTSVSDGLWQSGAAWSTGFAPTNTNVALLTNAGTKTATIDDTTASGFPASLVVSGLVVSAPSGSFNTLLISNAGLANPVRVLNGFNILSNSEVVVVNSALWGGSASSTATTATNILNGNLTLRGSELVTTGLYTRIGTVAGAAPVVTLQDSLWRNYGGGGAGTNVIAIGSAGGALATVYQMSGTTLWTRGSAYIGYAAGATGQVILAGGELVCTNQSYFYIGAANGGRGFLTVSGGVFRGNGNFYIGSSATSDGTLVLAGGTSLVNCTVANIGNSTGRVIVAGGSVYSTNNGLIRFGSGVGSWIVSNGFMSVEQFVMGNTAGGNASFSVVGGTSILNHATVPALNIANLAGTTGRVAISGGLLVTTNATYPTRVGNAGFGQFTLSGGDWLAGHVQVGYTQTAAGSSLAINGGTFTATNAAFTNYLNVLNGSLVLSGGTSTVARLFATNGASSVVTFNGGWLATRQTVVSNGSAFVVGDGSSTADYTLLGGTHSYGNGLTLASNATLRGTGAVLSATTVNDGGALAPGFSPGTLVFSNDLTLNDASILRFELGPHDTSGLGFVGMGSNDLAQVVGNLTLDGILNVSALSGYTNFSPTALTNVYRLFSYNGALVDHGLAIGNLGDPGLSGWVGSGSGEVNLFVIAMPIPEPRAGLALVLGAAFLVWFLRVRSA